MNKKYPFLDGIRGVAALLVLLRHTTKYWNLTIFHSYLAVDLFFLLSGFVIAFAYEDKLRRGALSLGDFARIRLIRLYPMYLLSLAIAVAVAFLLVAQGLISTWDVLASAVAALFFLPSVMPGDHHLFFLNGPYWSLFFELIVNLLYAVLCPFLSTRLIVVLISGFGVVMAMGSFHFSGLDVGWQWGVFPMAVGLARAGFCILLGCLLFRCKPVLEQRLGRLLGFSPLPWVAFFLMAAILLVPNARQLNAVFDLFAVVVAFPILILAAARGDGGRWQNVLLMLGACSYPIYVLHEPVAKGLFLLWPETIARFAPLSGLVFMGLIVMAALWLEKRYDIPLRRWLSQRKAGPAKAPLTAKSS